MHDGFRYRHDVAAKGVVHGPRLTQQENVYGRSRCS